MKFPFGMEWLDWFRIPLHLRLRWWTETDSGSAPAKASDDLLDRIERAYALNQF